MTKKAKDLRPKALQGVRNPDLYDKNGNLFERIGQAASQAAYDEYAAHTGRLGHEAFKEGARFNERHYDYENPLWHLGESTWDSPSLNNATPEDMYDARAKNQPWWSQWGSGALKMVGTGVTTFLDGTLGMIAGLGQGASNLFDGDEKTGFMDGIWNNGVTNAMAEISEKMEEALPNYMTQWEQNAPWYQRIFSGEGGANFWANDILKNAGFTLGAAASIWAMGGVGNALKGVGWLGKAGKALGLLNKAGEATRVGKFAAGTAKLITSTIGESATEALNTYRDNAKLMDQNLSQAIQAKRAEAMQRYQEAIASGMDETLAHSVLSNDLNKINADAQAYKSNMDKTLIDASNAVMGVNMAVLSLSNYLSLGSLVKGGYGNAKSLLDMATKTVDGKAVTSTTDIAKGMLKGTLKFESPEIKHGMAKVAGRWALDTTQEGLEEGVQGLASTTAQMNTQGKMNRWAKKNSCLGSMINPDATEACADFATALGQAYEEQFGNAGSSGWSEVAAGFISGALGVGGVHRNKNNKLRPTWNGGLKEAYESVYGEKGAIDDAIGMMNKSLTSGEFGERVKNAVQNMAIKSKQDSALRRGDVQGYKNAETEQLVLNAIHAREFGLLDSYMEMFDELEKGVSDADVEELKTLAAKEDGGSALDKKKDDEIKEIYREKARTAKEKLKTALEEYDRADEQYGDMFSPENRQFAIKEIAYQNTLMWDTFRRMDELDKEMDTLKQKQREGKITPSEETVLKQKEKAYKDLQKQATALKDSLNETKNNPEKLDKTITALREKARKQQLYSQAEKAIEKYSEAQTVGDILDVYENSPEEKREEVLNQAIEQAEGETKDKLTQFKNYMEDVDVLEAQIAKEFPLTEGDPMEQIEYQQAFHYMLDEIKNEILHDENPVLTRESIKDRLLKKIAEQKDLGAQSLEKSQGVVVDEEGHIIDTEARKNGVVDDDDYYQMLNDENELEWGAGDRVKDMAQAFMDSKMFDKMAKKLQNLADKIEQLDDLRKSAKKPDPKKSPRNTEERKKREEEEKKIIESEGVVLEEGESLLDDEDEDEDDDDGLNFDNEVDGEGVETPEGTPGGKSSKEEEKEEEKGKGKGKGTGKPKSKGVLTAEEKKKYKEEEKKGASGIIYHVASLLPGKKADKGTIKTDGDSVYERMMKVGNQFSRLSLAVENGNAKAKIAKSFSTLKDLIAEHPVSNSLMKAIEKFIKDNKLGNSPSKRKGKTPAKTNEDDKKPKGKGAQKGATLSEDNEGKEKANVSFGSLNGSTNPMYVKSKIKQGHLIDYTPKGSLQEFLWNAGINLVDNVNTYIPQIIEKDSKEKDVKKHTPIHYLHNSNRPNDILLAVKASDIKNVKAHTKLVSIDGVDYIILGNVGYDKMYRPETEEMFNNLLEECTNEHEDDKEWYVSPNTNRVKDATSGHIITEITEDTDEEGSEYHIPHEVSDLSEAMNRSGVYTQDLKFLVLEGKEGAITKKTINVDDEKEHAYGVPKGKPGQVYVYAKTPLGDYVPVYLQSVFYSDMISIDKFDNSTIANKIHSLFTTLADPNKDFKEKKKAIAELNDYLVFSEANIIHVNDESWKSAPNTITFTINGVVADDFTIDFNEDVEMEKVLYTMEQAVQAMNPRMAINVKTLQTNPQAYLDAGMLRTDAALLRTAGMEFFIYPTDSNNDFYETKQEKPQVDPDYNTRENFYLDNELVYYDGETFYNRKGEKLDDQDKYKTALAIKQGKIEVKSTAHSHFYIDGDSMYVANGHGGYTLLSDEEKAKALTMLKNYEKKQARDKKVAEGAEKAKGKEAKPGEVEETPDDEEEDGLDMSLMQEPEEETEDNKIILPDFADTMKGQLGDKKSKWDTYFNDTTRKDKEGLVYSTGMYFQSVISPALSFMQEAGMLPHPKEYYITEHGIYLDKWFELTSILKEYQIDTPADLIPWVEKHAGMSTKFEKETPADMSKNEEEETPTPPKKSFKEQYDEYRATLKSTSTENLENTLTVYARELSRKGVNVAVDPKWNALHDEFISREDALEEKGTETSEVKKPANWHLIEQDYEETKAFADPNQLGRALFNYGDHINLSEAYEYLMSSGDEFKKYVAEALANVARSHGRDVTSKPSTPLEDTQEKAKHFGIHKNLKIDDKYIGTPKVLTLEMIPKLSALPDDRKELKALYDLTDGNLMIAEDKVDPVIHVIVDKKPMFLVEAYYKFILNKDITDTTNPENSEEKSDKEKKNFVNGTDISELKTAKELEESRNSNTFVAELLKVENASILDRFFDVAIDKFGLDEDATPKQLADMIQEKMDVTGLNLETALEIFENCK